MSSSRRGTPGWQAARASVDGGQWVAFSSHVGNGYGVHGWFMVGARVRSDRIDLSMRYFVFDFSRECRVDVILTNIFRETQR